MAISRLQSLFATAVDNPLPQSGEELGIVEENTR
jgi:hypothetical protein